jgi:murein DD-endopeptidase MepM/ murein hydrolase activator NlpD
VGQETGLLELKGKSRRARRTFQGAAAATAVGAVLFVIFGSPFSLHAERDPGSIRLSALTPSESGPADAPVIEPDIDSGQSGLKTVPDAEAEAAALTPIERVMEVKRGDTFMKLMLDAGVDRAEAHAAIAAKKDLFDPRHLRPGLAVTVTFTPAAPDDTTGRFEGYRFSSEPERAIVVRRNGDGNTFEAETIERRLDAQYVRLAGTIDSNLYTAARRSGLPAGTLVDMIRLFSWDVDFQRNIQQGDTFDVLVERLHFRDGEIARWGDIVYAELTLSGERLRLFRFEDSKGNVEYFDEKGQSAQKALMKTPIDGARLSSGFGRRQHPILGYTRMHQGVDFAAPPGTPIYAAGNGTIAQIGRNGGYGNYIRIRHNDRYSTAYAHMQGFARGLQRGSRVRQGQVIGYVGSTGASTGPHLHYEIHVGGQQVNPMTVKMPSGRQLAGRELAQFRSAQDTVKDQLAAIQPETAVAAR